MRPAATAPAVLAPAPPRRWLRPGQRPRGFTLLELMVVIAIVALGSALASLALRDGESAALAREGERLAALLDAARAQSRAAGVPVRWRVTESGFAFEGLPPSAAPLPTRWLDANTVVLDSPVLQLGPEPIIGAQAVFLQRSDGAVRRVLRVATDGLRPFVAEPLQ